jgi:small-conductance mechanosensitive channel
METVWSGWAWWMEPFVWTVVILGIAAAIGFLLRRIVVARLLPFVQTGPEDWADIVIGQISRRIPIWSLLVGAWLAASRWPMTPTSRTFTVRALSALGVASVTLEVSAIAARLVRAYGPRLSPEAPPSALSQNLVRIFVTTIGVLVIVRSFGYDITPVLTALGVGGLAVALALQGPLSNLFAGMFVTFAGQLRIGDYVRLESGVEGYITDLNWHSTNIRMPAGPLVIVPNAKLAQSVATNFSQPGRDVGFVVEFGVAYASDLEHVERAAIAVGRAVMREVPGGVADFEPVVQFFGLTDLLVQVKIVLRAREFVDQARLRHEFLKRMLLTARREGIVLPHQPRPMPPPSVQPRADTATE